MAKRLITAFGTTMGIYDWARDPRCSVGPLTLSQRITQGEEPEDAITRPRQHKQHGKSSSRLYRIWHGIKQRCKNSNSPNYPHYGARGISLCDAWSKDFVIFSTWALANGYQDDLEIDRIDNDGNYEPSNCRFVTSKVNQRNRRSNTLITYRNVTKCISEWAEDSRCVVSYGTLLDRLELGWSLHRALTTPPDHLHGAIMIEAFNERRSLIEWSRDPRCVVSRVGLTSRLNAGMDPEEAITTPSKTTFVMLDIFGEVKTVNDWVRDPRCVVSRTALQSRIKRGMTPEQALTTPQYRCS